MHYVCPPALIHDPNLWNLDRTNEIEDLRTGHDRWFKFTSENTQNKSVYTWRKHRFIK